MTWAAMTLSAVDQREEDIDLLRALNGHVEQHGFIDEDGDDATPSDLLTRDEAKAFDDMLDKLTRAPKASLSDRQRGWSSRVAERLSLSYGDPSRRNRNVPVGNHVAPVTGGPNRPLRPPGRV